MMGRDKLPFVGEPPWKQKLEDELAVQQRIFDAYARAERATWRRALWEIPAIMAVVVVLPLLPFAWLAWYSAGMEGFSIIAATFFAMWAMLSALGLFIIHMRR